VFDAEQCVLGCDQVEQYEQAQAESQEMGERVSEYVSHSFFLLLAPFETRCDTRTGKH
jgi:hypothetical protein